MPCHLARSPQHKNRPTCRVIFLYIYFLGERPAALFHFHVHQGLSTLKEPVRISLSVSSDTIYLRRERNL